VKQFSGNAGLTWGGLGVAGSLQEGDVLGGEERHRSEGRPVIFSHRPVDEPAEKKKGRDLNRSVQAREEPAAGTKKNATPPGEAIV